MYIGVLGPGIIELQSSRHLYCRDIAIGRGMKPLMAVIPSF